jgi:hypothetical protein
VQAVLDDVEAAPIAAGLRATLRLLEKLTLEPAALAADDVRAVRRAGVSDAAIADAIHVGALFNVINRCADALGFELPPPAPPDTPPPLLERGYLAWFPEARALPAAGAAAS